MESGDYQVLSVSWRSCGSLVYMRAVSYVHSQIMFMVFAFSYTLFKLPAPRRVSRKSSTHLASAAQSELIQKYDFAHSRVFPVCHIPPFDAAKMCALYGTVCYRHTTSPAKRKPAKQQTRLIPHLPATSGCAVTCSRISSDCPL